MSVTVDDVRHIAALARLGLPADRAVVAAEELNTILSHMEVLSRVDTTDVGEAVAASTTRMPLRADQGPPVQLAASTRSFAPDMREGFFLVPRLATHEDPEAAS